MAPSILVVDDDSDDCEIVMEALQQAGWHYQVNCVYDAIEALSFLEEKNKSNTLPAVIILDLNMPKVSGLELLVKIKYLLNTDVPIILYTTTCSDEMVKEAKKMGAHDCVKKGTSYADNVRFSRLVLSLVSKT